MLNDAYLKCLNICEQKLEFMNKIFFHLGNVRIFTSSILYFEKFNMTICDELSLQFSSSICLIYSLFYRDATENLADKKGNKDGNRL